eukprot:g36540.t1
MVSKFADGIKIGGEVDIEGGYFKVQQDLDQMGPRAKEWQTDFNLDKHELQQFGRANQGRTYTLNGKILSSFDEQRNLGVQVHRSLKVESQINRVVKTTFGIPAFIGQRIENRRWEVMLQLYRTLVRPLLEYCILFWCPCHRKDVVKLERVQKRFRKMLSGLEGLSYRERLNRLGLFSLEQMLRGDLLQVYKLIRTRT